MYMHTVDIYMYIHPCVVLSFTYPFIYPYIFIYVQSAMLLEDADPVLLFLSLSAALHHVVRYLWRDRLPDDVECVGHVSSLHIYPVKSGGGMNLDHATLTSAGFSNTDILDRYILN